VGNFPVLWTEWNGLYRDEIRDFWRGHSHGVAGLASRLTGSSDLYQDDGRHPSASINFVTAHDGFTMADLVSYDHKHNEANGEDNRDGTDDNRSWNHGAEGPNDDPGIRALRARQVRNMLATLLLSQGVPMILGGDESGRTQHGNNNAYCQDNEISWLDWDLDDERRSLLEFSRRLIALRAAHPVFRRRHFFGGAHGDSGLPDIRWLRPDGREMSRRDWGRDDLRTLGVFLNGEEIPGPGPDGERVLDDTFVLLLNAHHEPAEFRLPARRFGNRWRQVFSTAEPDEVEGARSWLAWARVHLEARSVLLMRRAW
jgi:isoamylase